MLTVSATQQIIERMLRPIKQRVMMTIARGILELADDTKGIQLAKVTLMKDETREGLERVQNFGFTSNPPDQSEVVALFVGGNREHGFVVACDHRASRKKGLQKGECAVYTDDGTYIILKKGGEVEIKAATKVTLDAPNVEMTGNLKVNGTLDAAAATVASLTTPGVVSAGSIVATGAIAGASVAAPTISAGGTSVGALAAAYDAHKHPETGTITGTTDSPI